MNDIIITLKLYSGLEKESGILNYNPDTGIIINVRKGTRLKKILSDAGMEKFFPFAFFSGGERITLRRKFNESSEVSCLKISGGG
ncbi:MAG TPA: hypothetical protein P5120_06920 [Spirochaetota bacterium]|nr:hypothetical protein [Spirochaetota bacterium]HPF07038.1 hypothetical protein [Spirochaetota bacterium]HPJ42292.1 hypothetical protein [Spirochaetota bacterium]HPR36999.1 hypothetical protein [Spirochaetota bacterium]HRX47233.1 hypothetical protein [Spirochaetota bacterium]